MSVSETINAFSIGAEWVSLSSLLGRPPSSNKILQNCGRPGDIIELVISNDEPGVSFRGFRLDQIKSIYNLPAGSVDAWVRYIRNDGNELGIKTCLLQISEPLSISDDSYSLALSENPVGGYISSVSSEPSYIVDALGGSLYTASGSFTMMSGMSYALVFDMPKSLIVRKLKALSDNGARIDIAAYNQSATGVNISSVSFVNVNECSELVTGITAEFIGPSVVTAGDVIDFDVDSFDEPIIIGCEGLALSVVFTTRQSMVNENVRWVLTFEELAKKPGAIEPPLQLEAGTLLSPTTEMSIYN